MAEAGLEASEGALVTASVQGFSAWNYCTRAKNEEEKEIWTCSFCNCTFKDWNVSKALAHIGKLRGQSIVACKSSAITVKEAELFAADIAHKAAVQSKKRSQAEVRLETSSTLMAVATTSVVAKRSRGPSPVFGAASGFAQQSLPELLMQQDDDNLTSHIANFVLANGLDFSLVD